jgi:7,8-dihydropterin-6-yl-methyl-4-(beta-D-ribofuranosyl)aminobenzene 5'-phosphate synthase
MTEPASQLLIVYDNYTLKKNLIPAWGFSCLIILPQYQILFDTGGDPSTLINNMQELGLDFQKIDAVALSHIHGDHVGGLAGLLQHKQNITVYLPKSFPGSFRGTLRQMGATVEEIGGHRMIHPGVYTTGELGSGLKEESLVLKTRRGLVIITGCAHPGIVEIVEHATAVFKEKVYLLVGGFHLMGYSLSELKKIAKRLDALQVEKIAPCHCSGDETRDFFKEYYKDNYITCAAGLLLSLPELEQ